MLPPLGRDLPCPSCGCAHRFAPCDLHPECTPHPFEDEVSP